MAVRIKRSNIRKQYEYGERLTHPDGRFAEVLRVDNCCNTWHAFFYSKDGRMWVIGHHERGDVSKGEAVCQAMRYLRHEVLPQGELERPYLTKESFFQKVE